MRVKASLVAGKTYTEGQSIKAQMEYSTFEKIRSGMQNLVEKL